MNFNSPQRQLQHFSIARAKFYFPSIASSQVTKFRFGSNIHSVHDCYTHLCIDKNCAFRILFGFRLLDPLPPHPFPCPPISLLIVFLSVCQWAPMYSSKTSLESKMVHQQLIYSKTSKLPQNVFLTIAVCKYNDTAKMKLYEPQSLGLTRLPCNTNLATLWEPRVM